MPAKAEGRDSNGADVGVGAGAGAAAGAGLAEESAFAFFEPPANHEDGPSAAELGMPSKAGGRDAATMKA